jgi:hypothetical protein
VDALHGLDLVPPQLDADGVLVAGGEDVEGVAAHPERAGLEGGVVALVVDVDEAADEGAPLQALPHLQEEVVLAVLRGRAEAVDAGDRRHDDDVPPRHERLRRAVPELLDLLVDVRLLGDVGVRLRHVRLGLVVVVVGDEVLHGVLGEEGPHLLVELGRERLVVADDERRPVQLLDGLRHDVRLADTRDPLQGDVALAGAHGPHDGVDGRPLVASGLERGLQGEGQRDSSRPGN